MGKYVYKFIPGKKIDARTTRMATVKIYDLCDGKEVGRFFWMRKPKETDIQSMVNQIITDREIYKIWNKV